MFLTDTQVDFLRAGVQPNVGMVITNTTQNTSGQVTAVTITTVTATGVTWDDGDAYRIVALDAAQRALIEQNLNVAVTHIHAALAASGACDCTFAAWANDWLAFLNSVIAASFYSCTCGRPSISALSDETRNEYRTWAQGQLDALRDGRFEVCAGETGSEFAITGWAEQGLTEAARARIIARDILRNM